MASKSASSAKAKRESAFLLIIFVVVIGLITAGLYSVTKSKATVAPVASVSDVSSQEVIIPVDVSMSDTDIIVGVGITHVIEAIGGKSISWNSSDEKVATVLSDGSVKGIGVGKCDITAENEFGRTAQCHVTVKKTVYLTIDDCPMGYTDEILKILKKHDVKATFFVMNTYNMKKLKDMYEQGHVIGLHTYSHNFKTCYRSQYSYFADLEKLSDIVEGYIGIRPKIFRFPGGTGNHVGGKLNMRRMVNGAEDLGYRGFDWTSASGDATRPRPDAKKAAENTLKTCKRDSDILLMHDKPCTPGCLEIVIPALKKQGYVFETLDHYPENSRLSKTWYERTVSEKEIPCESLKVDKESAEVKKGKTVKLKATMTPGKSTDYVRFVSDDPAVATVTLEGKIKGVAEGETAIRAIASSGQEAVCKVTVIK